MGGLLSLQHLDVSHNSLHHLTPHLSCLGQLTHLEASDNKLHQSAAVPEELASLTALRVRHRCNPGSSTALPLHICSAQLCLTATAYESLWALFTEMWRPPLLGTSSTGTSSSLVGISW